MAVERSDMSATTINGEIYLIGGCVGDQEWTPSNGGMYACTAVAKMAEKYNPETDTFVTLADAPRVRYRHAAAALGSQLYLFGGRDVYDALVSHVDVLDTSTGTWSTLSSLMPNPTSDLAAISFGSRIYTFGGYDAAYTAMERTQVFDPTEPGTGAWSSGGMLVQGRGDHAAALVGTSAFVLGGFHHGNDFEYPIDHMESLNLSNSTGVWTPHSEMLQRRGDKAVAVLNGLIHVVGGETKNSIGHSVPLIDVEVYDHSTDTWYEGGSIATNRFRFSAAAVENSIYIFGGQGFLQGSYGEAGSKYPVLADVEEYTETEDSQTEASGVLKRSMISSATLFCAAAALGV